MKKTLKLLLKLTIPIWILPFAVAAYYHIFKEFFGIIDVFIDEKFPEKKK